MPKGLHNWTYRDVVDFLREKGFTLYNERKGSHETWISKDKTAVVEVNFVQGNESYPIRTLETMIRQSKLDKKEWRKWGSQ